MFGSIFQLARDPSDFAPFPTFEPVLEIGNHRRLRNLRNILQLDLEIAQRPHSFKDFFEAVLQTSNTIAAGQRVDEFQHRNESTRLDTKVVNGFFGGLRPRFFPGFGELFPGPVK